MQLKAEILGIDSGGKPMVFLNTLDADEIGVTASERIRITSKANTITALVGIATTIKKGFVGINEEVLKILKLKQHAIVDIEVAPFPKSLQFIHNKLTGKRLLYDEIHEIVKDVVQGNLNESEIAAFVTTLHLQGLDLDEATSLAISMVNTGKQLKLGNKIIVDKHSIGGAPGDKTTLLVVPIVAAAGLIIPKASSRAITSAAGTADRAEAIMPVNLEIEEMKKVVKKSNGCIVWGGRLGIAPADDVIIDVEEQLSFESFDKVIVSIMAKKVAVSTNHLVLDIPVGPTMKIRHREDAERVEKKFKILGKKFDMEIVADINESREPAGQGVGPMLEARDVLSVLEQKKNRPLPLEEKALRLTGKLLDICFEDAKIKKRGNDEARKILESGKALKKFREIVREQEGDRNVALDNLIMRSHKNEVKSETTGVIKKVNNYNLNTIAKILGAPDDKQAGVLLAKRINDSVEKNEPLLFFHSSDKHRINEAQITLEHFPVYEIEK